MKNIQKIVLSIVLVTLPIFTIGLAGEFVDVFCPYFGYEKMKIESSFVPGAFTIIFALVIACLFKMWVLDNKRGKNDKIN